MRFFYTIIIALYSILLVSCGSDKNIIERALKAEAAAKYQQACSLYAVSVISNKTVRKYPDSNRSKFIDPDVWKSELRNYMAWITGTRETNLEVTIQGVERCGARIKEQNSFINVSVKNLEQHAFDSIWTIGFFAEGVQRNGVQFPLMQEAFTHNFSFVKLTAGIKYSYSLWFVRKNNYKVVTFFQYPETNTYILLAPGEYLVFIQSRISFSNTQMWLSEYSGTTVSVPASPSLIAIELRTRIDRN